jgi:hypothetical protein
MRARTRRAILLAATVASVGCLPEEVGKTPKNTLVIGLDVSGSFRKTGYYRDAIEFAAYYIYAHLNSLGELKQPSELFVASVGGQRPGETKAFHPIHDFSGKTPEEIAASLREWFPVEDQLTDFNAFFVRVAELVKERGLILQPLNVVIFSDGVHDMTGRTRRSDESMYKRVDLAPLEYLSRNVTVRLLYAAPPVAEGWKREIDRRRVRMWTVEQEVMEGWRTQHRAGQPPEVQDSLWKWVRDNVDFPARRGVL